MIRCGVCCKHQQTGRQLPTAIAEGGLLLGWVFFNTSGYHASVYTIAAISVNIKKLLSMMRSKYDRSQGRQKKNVFLTRLCHLLVLQQDKTKYSP